MSFKGEQRAYVPSVVYLCAGCVGCVLSKWQFVVFQDTEKSVRKLWDVHDLRDIWDIVDGIKGHYVKDIGITLKT